MPTSRRFRRPSRSLRTVVAIAVIAVVLLVVPWIISERSGANSARFYFSDLPGSVAIGQTFPVSLRVQTSTSINALEVVMRYDPVYLDIVSMTTDQSFCSFYADNTFDTIKGEVHLSCGTPNPGFSGDSVVFTLQMRAKIAGNVNLTLDPKQTSVLANDGKGSKLSSHLPTLHVTTVTTY